MLGNLMVKDFIKELGSNSPAPGGGSVAALSASLASALGAMVCNLTVGKKAFNEYDEEKKQLITSSLEKTDLYKDEFLSLMEKDTEEFLVLMEAFKLPKTTDEEKAYRNEKITEGYKKALEIPFNVAKKAYSIYDHINIAATLGNKNAVSDAGVAALLLQAAIESAILNVKINLTAINDGEYKNEITKECENIVEKGISKRNEILSIVNSKI